MFIPPTKRLNIPYFDALSRMQKACRRCDEKEFFRMASEMDLNGNGNATFLRWLLYCDEDIGLASPMMGSFVLEQYIKWKKVLKDNKVSPSKSYECKEAKRILFSTAFAVATSSKSRICGTASPVSYYMGLSLISSEVEASGIENSNNHEEFRKALKNKDEYRALGYLSKIWGLCKDSPKKEKSVTLNVIIGMIYEETKVYKKAIKDRFEICRLGDYHMLYMVSAVLLCIREPPYKPILLQTKDYIELHILIYYDLKLKVPDCPDYVYDRHTSKGKSLGRGFRHFFDVGAHIEKCGYEDIYHPIAKYIYMKREKQEEVSNEVINKKLENIDIVPLTHHGKKYNEKDLQYLIYTYSYNIDEIVETKNTSLKDGKICTLLTDEKCRLLIKGPLKTIPYQELHEHIILKKSAGVWKCNDGIYLVKQKLRKN